MFKKRAGPGFAAVGLPIAAHTADGHKKTPRFSLGRAGSCSSRRLRRHTSRKVWEASFASMNGWESRSIKFEVGDQALFQFQSHIESGSLLVELAAPDGTTVVRWGDKPSETTAFTASAAGRHRVRVTADHASGGYRLELLDE